MEKYFKPIHLACLINEYSPNQALIEIKNGIATATNGAVIVKVDLNKTASPLIVKSIDFLNDKYVHMEVWKEIYKCDILEIDDSGIHCFKNGFRKSFDFSEPNGEFFKIDTLIADIQSGGEEKKRCVSFSSNLISIITKVFETQQLNYSFSHGKKGTVVFPYEESGMYAILMPIDTVVNRYMFT